MSDHPENHLDQTGVALSALVACIARTLGESNPAFLPAFEKNLEDVYYHFRDSGQPNIGVLESLTCVRDLLKK